MSDWAATCVLCARRGRQTRLDQGHICPSCLVRLGDTLDDIVRLASLASIEPRTGSGGGRSVPASRPPLNVDGIDPALTMATIADGVQRPVLVILEQWEILIRQERHLVPYGVASAYRRATIPRGSSTQTTATLTGVCGFLRASLPWWADSPDQPIDDFSDEIRACRRALVRFDPDREPMGYVAFCPSDGCGAKLRYHSADEAITCPRCHETRDVPRLVAVVLSDPDCQDIWADVTTAAQHYGVSERRVRQMVAEEKVERVAGKYRIALRSGRVSPSG